MKGKLYLLPMPISENAKDTIHPSTIALWHRISYFFIEEIKPVRRVMKGLDKTIDIDSKEFILINEHHEPDYLQFDQWIDSGKDVGLMSDAGTVAVADPGKNLIRYAHEKGIQIIPILSPSSIIMALMSSGLQGQRFSFKGYLPKDPSERKKTLKQYEEQASKNDESIIFMDAPYRNNQVMKDAMDSLSPHTMLCVAKEITSSKEWIQTKNMAQWKQDIPDLHKSNVMFVLGK